MCRTLIAVPLLLAAVASAQTRPVDDLPTALTNKDWPAVLRITNKLLTLRGKAAGGADRETLWLAKAEAELQSGQIGPAAEAFARAAAEPGVSQDQADWATAMNEVVKKSDRRGYHHAATKQEPNPPAFDLLDASKRPDALAALWVADFDAATARIDKAKNATEQQAVVGLAKLIAALRPLDRVVHKSSAQTDALEQTAASDFAASVQGWASKATAALADIQAQADQQVEQTSRDAAGRVTVTHHRQGTTSAQQGDVKKYMETAQTFAGTYTAVHALLSAQARPTIEPLKEAVQTVYDRAEALRNQAYRPR